MGNRPTIDDVAAEAGVSTATVSAVINNKPSVGADTREKVLDVIHELDYRPRGQKRQLLKRKKQRSVGFIIKEAENPFYAEIARGIRSYAHEENFSVYVVSSEGQHREEVDLVALMQSQGVEGLIITPALGDADDLSYLFDLNRAAYPLVLLEEVKGLRTDVISVDNIEMMEKVVGYLIDRGHERILHFAGPDYSIHTRERIRGFRGAFSTSRLVFEKELVIPAGAHLADGYQAARAYFESVSDWNATAVTCYNDQIAVGVSKFLIEQDFDIPGDVEIFGYDNIEWLDYLPVPISSVQAPLVEIGTRAAELLIRRIQADVAPSAERVTYHGQLVVRDREHEGTRVADKDRLDGSAGVEAR